MKRKVEFQQQQEVHFPVEVEWKELHVSKAVEKIHLQEGVIYDSLEVVVTSKKHEKLFGNGQVFPNLKQLEYLE